MNVPNIFYSLHARMGGVDKDQDWEAGPVGNKGLNKQNEFRFVYVEFEGLYS